VNQIIGRCIRHQRDYASIFLIDERYNEMIHISKLSKWIRDRLRVSDINF
jgi:chromosome transmission fidelity protein 1